MFPAARSVELQDRDRPSPDSKEVLIATETSMVSTGTEITILSGEYPEGSHWDTYGDYPFVTGYSNVGTVVQAGADVDIEEGERVASMSPHAEYITASAADCIPVPDGLSDEEAASFAIAQIAMNGVRRSRVNWGETAVVYGLGIVGQLTVRLCRLAGVETVVGIDLAENRLSYLPNDPGIVGVNPTEDDPVDIVDDVTDGRMADVVFEVTGSPDAIPNEFDVLHQQGRLVILSSPHGETTLDFHDYVNMPSHEIIGAHMMSHPDVATQTNPWTLERHAELSYSYLLQDRLQVDDLFSHVCDYEDAPALYRELLEDRTQAMGVRIEW